MLKLEKILLQITLSKRFATLTYTMSSKTSDSENTVKDSNAPPLTKDESDVASGNLLKHINVIRGDSDVDFISSDQQYAIFSFRGFQKEVKIPGTNEKVFGIIKFRGAYGSTKEASEKSYKIIKNHDSVNICKIAKSGKWFPLTNETGFCHEIDDVDGNGKIDKFLQKMRKNTVEEQNLETSKKAKELRGRKEKLIREAKEDINQFEKGSVEYYTKLRVYENSYVNSMKIEQAIVSKGLKLMKELKQDLDKARKEIDEMNLESPSYSSQWRDIYVESSGCQKYTCDENTFPERKDMEY